MTGNNHEPQSEGPRQAGTSPEVPDAERLERIAELWIEYRKALRRGEYLHANDLSGDPEALLEIAARLRTTNPPAVPLVASPTVTTEERELCRRQLLAYADIMEREGWEASIVDEDHNPRLTGPTPTQIRAAISGGGETRGAGGVAGEHPARIPSDAEGFDWPRVVTLTCDVFWRKWRARYAEGSEPRERVGSYLQEFGMWLGLSEGEKALRDVLLKLRSEATPPAPAGPSSPPLDTPEGGR